MPYVYPPSQRVNGGASGNANQDAGGIQTADGETVQAKLDELHRRTLHLEQEQLILELLDE